MPGVRDALGVCGTCASAVELAEVSARVTGPSPEMAELMSSETHTPVFGGAVVPTIVPSAGAFE